MLNQPCGEKVLSSNKTATNRDSAFGIWRDRRAFQERYSTCLLILKCKHSIDYWNVLNVQLENWFPRNGIPNRSINLHFENFGMNLKFSWTRYVHECLVSTSSSDLESTSLLNIDVHDFLRRPIIISSARLPLFVRSFDFAVVNIICSIRNTFGSCQLQGINRHITPVGKERRRQLMMANDAYRFFFTFINFQPWISMNHFAR